MIKPNRTPSSILLLLLLILYPAMFYGQVRDMVVEHQYEEQLKAIDPTLVETFKRATIALDEPNYVKADSLYYIIYQKAPTFDPAIRRLASAKQALGENKYAISLAEKALNLNRSSANIITLANILIYSENDNSIRVTENLNQALNLLYEGQKLKEADDFEYTVMIAQASLQLYRIDVFKNAAYQLNNKYPDKMASHYFAAIAATEEENWIVAEDEIMKAKNLGLPQEDVDRMLDSGIHTKALTEKCKKIFLWILIIWASGFIILYITGMFLSNYTLSAITRQLKTHSTNKTAHIIRRIYSFLINTAGIYYYISLPIILVLVVALAVGIFYLFLMIGHIPIQLMFIILIGSCFTIYGMIRSLILKVNYEEPGRELKRSEAPALFALTEEVAKTMETRPIDEIRITPETDLAVYELGSWKEKLQDSGKRILILGAGVIKDFKQNDFRAVLAHEYGHFSHRDTAGGDVALRVRNDMHKYYFALYHAGQAVWWNLAFQFIRLYNFIFSRISNGSTRLQEILADRVAAQTYGELAFKNGLTYVIKRNIEFVKFAKIEIEDAKKNKRAFNNLYDISAHSIDSVQEELDKALNRETSKDDTHPSPVDRFRFIEGLGNEKHIENDIYVRDLFKDWDSITLEMTKKIEDSWKNSD